MNTQAHNEVERALNLLSQILRAPEPRKVDRKVLIAIRRAELAQYRNGK